MDAQLPGYYIYKVWAFESRKVQIGDLLEAVAAAGNDGRHHYQAKFIKEIPADQVLRIQP